MMGGGQNSAPHKKIEGWFDADPRPPSFAILPLKTGVSKLKPRQPRYGDIFAGHDEGEAMAEMGRVFWAEYAADLEARGLFSPSRAKILDRLVRLRVEYEVNYPVAVQQGPTKESAEGGQYVNMLWSMVQKMSDQILKLEAALTLTPLSVGAKADERPKGDGPPAGASKYLERARAN